MISVKIIEDSYSSHGIRLTTYLLTYPKFIHPQVLTHRVFSRNTSSSRAIPVSKMISSVEQNPVKLTFHGKNQKGMQSYGVLDSEDIEKANVVWDEATASAIYHAKRLAEIGLHKQYVNRLLEPFAHVTTILTATDYANFFALRVDHGAQPEIQMLASEMQKAMHDSVPEFKNKDEWHIPFILDEEKGLSTGDKLKISVARCARISYKSYNTESNSGKDEDIALYEKLAEEKHWSPFEHQAVAIGSNFRSGNFRGWRQLRKLVDRDSADTTIYVSPELKFD